MSEGIRFSADGRLHSYEWLRTGKSLMTIGTREGEGGKTAGTPDDNVSAVRDGQRGAQHFYLVLESMRLPAARGLHCNNLFICWVSPWLPSPPHLAVPSQYICLQGSQLGESVQFSFHRSFPSEQTWDRYGGSWLVHWSSTRGWQVFASPRNGAEEVGAGGKRWDGGRRAWKQETVGWDEFWSSSRCQPPNAPTIWSHRRWDADCL